MSGYKKRILFCGNRLVLCCDGKCNKAWGINNRPENSLSDDPDDTEYLADGELGDAPDCPGTWEGGHGKPAVGLLNKWCARECERSDMFEFGEPIELKDLSVRFPNKRPESGHPLVGVSLTDLTEVGEQYWEAPDYPGSNGRCVADKLSVAIGAVAPCDCGVCMEVRR